MGLIQELKVLDKVPTGGTMINAVDFVVNWARANSLWPLTYGTSCCAIEMMAASMPRYDIARFGSEVFRASPRQADLIILAGTIVDKMAGPLVTLYEQMPGPKYVIAMGACTISGGPFYYDSYSVVKGADRVIPVDVFIPGCPPRPEALFDGLMKLQEKIKQETLRVPWKAPDINNSTFGDRHSEAAAAWEELERIKDQEMAEARAKFKEENPEYKAPKHAKKIVEKFDAVDFSPKAHAGLAYSEIYSIVANGFPEATLPPEILESIAPDFKLLDEKPDSYIIDFNVAPKNYHSFIRFLKEEPRLDMDFLIELTAIDWKDHFDVVVHLTSTTHAHKVFIRTSIERPEGLATSIIPTISDIYAGANWHEREVFDFFGIEFKDHNDMRRIFLPEDFEGWPLRKDFEHQNVVRRPY